MTKNTSKEIEILLIPNDFKNCEFLDINDCALARAVKRHFKIGHHIGVGGDIAYIIKNNGDCITSYDIKDGFDAEDYYFVKDEYKKDPKMLKGQYVVTLIKQ